MKSVFSNNFTQKIFHVEKKYYKIYKYFMINTFICKKKCISYYFLKKNVHEFIVETIL